MLLIAPVLLVAGIDLCTRRGYAQVYVDVHSMQMLAGSVRLFIVQVWRQAN